MASASWLIKIDEKPVKIEVDHNIFSGKRVIRIDNSVVCRGTKFPDFGSEHTFTVGSHHFTVNIKTNNLPVKYELYIDGLSQGEQHTPIPQWAWLFIIPFIIAIPFTRGHGVIPAAISGGIAGLGFGIPFMLAPIPSIKPVVKFVLGLLLSVGFALLVFATKVQF